MRLCAFDCNARPRTHIDSMPCWMHHIAHRKNPLEIALCAYDIRQTGRHKKKMRAINCNLHIVHSVHAAQLAIWQQRNMLHRLVGLVIGLRTDTRHIRAATVERMLVGAPAEVQTLSTKLPRLAIVRLFRSNAKMLCRRNVLQSQHRWRNCWLGECAVFEQRFTYADWYFGWNAWMVDWRHCSRSHRLNDKEPEASRHIVIDFIINSKSSQYNESWEMAIFESRRARRRMHAMHWNGMFLRDDPLLCVAMHCFRPNGPKFHRLWCSFGCVYTEPSRHCLLHVLSRCLYIACSVDACLARPQLRVLLCTLHKAHTFTNRCHPCVPLDRARACWCVCLRVRHQSTFGTHKYPTEWRCCHEISFSFVLTQKMETRFERVRRSVVAARSSPPPMPCVYVCVNAYDVSLAMRKYNSKRWG